MAAYEKTLACGATTLPPQGETGDDVTGETRAGYSAQGRGLDFCAPSSRVRSPQRPEDGGTQAATFAGGGIRGTAPLVVTYSRRAGSAGPRRVLSTLGERKLRPEDVAHAVGYFLDDRSAFVTGQVLYVCGGLTVGLAGA